MKYSQLIKHPLPPITSEMLEFVKNKEKEHVHSFRYEYQTTLYSAEILDNVLAVTLFRYEKGKLNTYVRHFYDGKNYATQRISDNTRLDGTIAHYLSYHYGGRLNGTDDVITEYFNLNNKAADDTLRGIQLLIKTEQDILDEKLKARHKKVTDKIDIRMSSVSEKPPKDFFDWVENWVLETARYFFYKYKKGKKQRGYCSHCLAEYEAENIKHNEKTVCPYCGSRLTCKAVGRTTQYSIRDSAAVAYVEEIEENGKPALVERIYNITQDISAHREGPRAMQKEVCYHEEWRIFIDKEKLSGSYGGYKDFMYVYGLFKGKGNLRWCGSEDVPQYNGINSSQMWIYPKNLDALFKTVETTEIRNIEASAVAAVCACELTRLVKILTEIPVLENFAKLGLHNLLRTLVKESFSYYSCHNGIQEYIDPKCKTVYAALGISKDVLKKMGDITEYEYLTYKRVSEIAPFKFETYRRFVDIGLCAENYSFSVSEILKKYKVSAEKFIGYFEKQKKLLKLKAGEVLTFYKDYLSMVKELKLPKTESVLFPRNVKQEHDRLMKVKADRKYDTQNKLLKKRVKILEMLNYEDKNFIIRPLKSADEFLKESSILNHCVKTYIDRCAEGKTNIFGIRKADAPDVPYFTLTLNNNAKVTQNLGKNNCYPPKEVKGFVKRWEKKVVEKNKQKFIEAVNGKPQKRRRTA